MGGGGDNAIETARNWLMPEISNERHEWSEKGQWKVKSIRVKLFCYGMVRYFKWIRRCDDEV